MRLFFDVLTRQTHSYDFSGRDFVRPEDAVQIAEAIAADLGSSENSNLVGSQIEVRNANGETLFTIPVHLAV